MSRTDEKTVKMNFTVEDVTIKPEPVSGDNNNNQPIVTHPEDFGSSLTHLAPLPRAPDQTQQTLRDRKAKIEKERAAVEQRENEYRLALALASAAAPTASAAAASTVGGGRGGGGADARYVTQMALRDVGVHSDEVVSLAASVVRRSAKTELAENGGGMMIAAKRSHVNGNKAMAAFNKAANKQISELVVTGKADDDAVYELTRRIDYVTLAQNASSLNIGKNAGVAALEREVAGVKDDSRFRLSVASKLFSCAVNSGVWMPPGLLNDDVVFDTLVPLHFGTDREHSTMLAAVVSNSNTAFASTGNLTQKSSDAFFASYINNPKLLDVAQIDVYGAPFTASHVPTQREILSVFVKWDEIKHMFPMGLTEDQLTQFFDSVGDPVGKNGLGLNMFTRTCSIPDENEKDVVMIDMRALLMVAPFTDIRIMSGRSVHQAMNDGIENSRDADFRPVQRSLCRNWFGPLVLVMQRAQERRLEQFRAMYPNAPAVAAATAMPTPVVAPFAAPPAATVQPNQSSESAEIARLKAENAQLKAIDSDLSNKYGAALKILHDCFCNAGIFETHRQNQKLTHEERYKLLMVQPNTFVIATQAENGGKKIGDIIADIGRVCSKCHAENGLRCVTYIIKTVLRDMAKNDANIKRVQQRGDVTAAQTDMPRTAEFAPGRPATTAAAAAAPPNPITYTPIGPPIKPATTFSGDAFRHARK